MQYHTYQLNNTRGSSPPFQNEQADDPAARPLRITEQQGAPLPKTDVAEIPPPADEPLWQDDGGEG